MPLSDNDALLWGEEIPNPFPAIDQPSPFAPDRQTKILLPVCATVPELEDLFGVVMQFDPSIWFRLVEATFYVNRPDLVSCWEGLPAGSMIRLNPAEPCEVQTSTDGTNWTTLFNRCESPEYIYRLYVTPAGGGAASFLAWDSTTGGDMGELIPGLYRLERESASGNIEDEFFVFSIGVRVASVQILHNAPPNTISVIYDDNTRNDIEIGLNTVNYSTGQGDGSATLSADKKTLNVVFPAAGEDGAPGAPGLPGQNGQDGQDGVGIESFVPLAIAGGTQITVTLTNGQHQIFTVFNGAQGAPGLPGQDGLTPQVTASAFGLPAGSAPTVTTTQAGANVNLRFGIPAGGGGGRDEVPEDVTAETLGQICGGAGGLLNYILDLYADDLQEKLLLMDQGLAVGEIVATALTGGLYVALGIPDVVDWVELLFTIPIDQAVLKANDTAFREQVKCWLYCRVKDEPDYAFSQAVYNDLNQYLQQETYVNLFIDKFFGYAGAAQRWYLYSLSEDAFCETFCTDCEDEETEWVLSLGDGVVQTGQYTFQMTAYLVPSSGRYIAGFRGSWTRGAEVVNFCPTAIDIVTSAPTALAVHAPCNGAQAGGFPGSSTPFDYIYVEFTSAQTITITIAPPTPPPN